jgi:hypothetical protein
MAIVIRGNTTFGPRIITSGYDPDAQAFLNAAAITDTTQATAVNDLVVGLKADSIWTKMKAIYPFVGGTATTHKWNLKNPIDSDAAFRLIFNGGWTHSTTGIKSNGSNGNADTKLIPSSDLTQDNTHMSYYSRENIYGTSCDMGVRTSGGSPTNDLSVYNYADGYYSDQYNYTTGRTSAAISNTSGFIIGSRTNSSTHKLFRNGSQIGSTNTSSSGNILGVNFSVYISALNSAGSGLYYSAREYAFASIGDGLTDTDAANLYTRVQTFQTSLARQV